MSAAKPAKSVVVPARPEAPASGPSWSVAVRAILLDQPEIDTNEVMRRVNDVRRSERLDASAARATIHKTRYAIKRQLRDGAKLADLRARFAKRHPQAKGPAGPDQAAVATLPAAAAPRTGPGSLIVTDAAPADGLDVLLVVRDVAHACGGLERTRALLALAEELGASRVRRHLDVIEQLRAAGA